MSATAKFADILDRLHRKIGMSQVPVPGMIMGLSGTDSIIAFILCYRALELTGRGDRLRGIHYIDADRTKPTWFQREIIPWLHEVCPKSHIEVCVPMGRVNRDQMRWADLMLRSLNVILEANIYEYPFGENYWVVNTINATEFELGSYSNLSKAASLSPIRSFWKSEILELCVKFGVPDVAIRNARLPDCLCGRAELAAENIELIDDILRHRLDPTKHDPELLKRLFEFIAAEKQYNGFKARIPFTV